MAAKLRKKRKTKTNSLYASSLRPLPPWLLGVHPSSYFTQTATPVPSLPPSFSDSKMIRESAGDDVGVEGLRVGEWSLRFQDLRFEKGDWEEQSIKFKRKK